MKTRLLTSAAKRGNGASLQTSEHTVEPPTAGTTTPAPSDFKIMTLRRPARCSCDSELEAGERAGWDRFPERFAAEPA